MANDDCIIKVIGLAQLSMEFLHGMNASAQALLQGLIEKVRVQTAALQAAQAKARQQRRHSSGPRHHGGGRRNSSRGEPESGKRLVTAVPQKCPYCPKRFQSEQFLNEHVLRRHASEMFANQQPVPPQEPLRPEPQVVTKVVMPSAVVHQPEPLQVMTPAPSSMVQQPQPPPPPQPQAAAAAPGEAHAGQAEALMRIVADSVQEQLQAVRSDFQVNLQAVRQANVDVTALEQKHVEFEKRVSSMLELNQNMLLAKIQESVAAAQPAKLPESAQRPSPPLPPPQQQPVAPPQPPPAPVVSQDPVAASAPEKPVAQPEVKQEAPPAPPKPSPPAAAEAPAAQEKETPAAGSGTTEKREQQEPGLRVDPNVDGTGFTKLWEEGLAALHTETEQLKFMLAMTQERSKPRKSLGLAARQEGAEEAGLELDSADKKEDEPPQPRRETVLTRKLFLGGVAGFLSRCRTGQGSPNVPIQAAPLPPAPQPTNGAAAIVQPGPPEAEERGVFQPAPAAPAANAAPGVSQPALAAPAANAAPGNAANASTTSAASGAVAAPDASGNAANRSTLSAASGVQPPVDAGNAANRSTLSAASGAPAAADDDAALRSILSEASGAVTAFEAPKGGDRSTLDASAISANPSDRGAIKATVATVASAADLMSKDLSEIEDIDDIPVLDSTPAVSSVRQEPPGSSPAGPPSALRRPTILATNTDSAPSGVTDGGGGGGGPFWGTLLEDSGAATPAPQGGRPAEAVTGIGGAKQMSVEPVDEIMDFNASVESLESASTQMPMRGPPPAPPVSGGGPPAGFSGPPVGFSGPAKDRRPQPPSLQSSPRVNNVTPMQQPADSGGGLAGAWGSGPTTANFQTVKPPPMDNSLVSEGNAVMGFSPGSPDSGPPIRQAGGGFNDSSELQEMSM
eukprot:gnl/TRDRNA2_/TRDRNA2_162812_c0_seq1.p1 gnl/TRDRNA2_/TRDRNA2_162812_c0~~gnl/TRDRNA2_/TRDRNA2_162812_c0_seq1.p1  ORF type:complete len:937 (-),score=219.91 gnl/TRDRNA2_/TRDRNA2_162812_c0_seq1:235-2955(-)